MRVALVSLFIKTVAFCAIVAMAPAGQESAVETCVLDDGSNTVTGQWAAAEAVCTSDNIHSSAGKPALHFHIPVDWKAGEKEYPIGWPRFNKQIQKEMQDWSGFDYLEFRVFTASSRTNLPDTPAGLNLYMPDRKHEYSRPLTELKIGQWTEFKIPLTDIVKTNRCTKMQFYVSESEYKDGDVVDFWIDRIAIIRHKEPTITGARLIEQAIMSDARSVGIEATVFGLRTNEHTTATLSLSSGGKLSVRGDVDIIRGTHTYLLPLSPGQLTSGGYYDVQLSHGGHIISLQRVRVINNPWQEVVP